MTHYSEAGKGADQRPTDHKKFSSGYDLIWGKKETTLDTNPETRAWYTVDELNEKFGDDDEVVEDEDDEDEICSGCSGSGEGMWDGATCNKCHGSGVEPCDKEDDI